MTDALGDRSAGLAAVLNEDRAFFERYARRIGAGDDAEDILQDVWLRLQTAEGPVGNPRAYLLRMIYTATLDRRRGMNRSMARDGAWAALSDFDEEAVALAPEAERALMARQQAERALTEIDSLGEPTAAIFRQHRIARRPQGQIAKAFGVSLSTVEKHLRRAYQVLARLEQDR